MQFGILRPFWGVGDIGRKRRSIFGEGKVGKCLEFENIWSAEEQEKEGNIWRRKMFGEGKYFVPRGKAKGGQDLEKENTWKREIFGEGKGRKYMVKENSLSIEEKENTWRGIIFVEGK